MMAFRKALGILVSLLTLAGLLVTVVLAARRIDQRPRTDDAYLQADLVHMAPEVSGRIVELDVRDNQAVHKAITNTKPTEAELEGARATLALAERDLNKTVVRAPCDGRITALDIAAGEFAATGHPLFTIIDTEHWYAIGNFRETDLAGMEPGQRATVYVMAQPSRPLRGQVDSLGWGVASDVSATIGGLPHVERTLNWVRIAARFPVRILLDAPPDDLMRFGATAVVVIDK